MSSGRWIFFRLIPANRHTSADIIFSKLDSSVIPYCKFRLALDIFEELSFIEYDIFNDTVKRIPDAKKTPLERSALFSSLLKFV